MALKNADKEKASYKQPVRKWLVLLIAVFFMLCVEIGFRIYFAQPDLVNRNIGKAIDSVPYLWEQIDRHKGTKIAWIGSSVMQGYLNAEADKTFPALVEKNLRETEKYHNAKSFNLAAAANNFGDHYCILTETLRHKPDLCVVAIHFKNFSQHTSTSTPLRRRSMISYIRNDPNLDEFLKRADMSKSEFWKHRVDNGVKKFWQFYRYRALLVQLLTGKDASPSRQIYKQFMKRMGFISKEQSELELHVPRDHDYDYLWKLLPESLILRNYKLCSTLDYTDSNINWRNFKELCKLGKRRKTKLLFYLTPINRQFIEEKKFFSWRDLGEYKQMVANEVRRNGHWLIDVTNEVDSAYFSDTDHINQNGHAQLSKRMTKEVIKALEKKEKRKKRRKGKK